MLTLPIKKKWFDMILSGEKKEEYRDCTRYYQSRLFRYVAYTIEDGEIREKEVNIRFRNGYRRDSPYFEATCSVSIGRGNPAWGAELGEIYYVITIKRIYLIQIRPTDYGGTE